MNKITIQIIIIMQLILLSSCEIIDYTDSKIVVAGYQNSQTIQAGETINMDVSIHNTSETSVFGVIGTLSSTSPFVTIKNGDFTYGNLTSDEYKTIYSTGNENFGIDDEEIAMDSSTYNAFSYTISSDWVDEDIEFYFMLTDKWGTKCVETFAVETSIPSVIISGYDVDDDGGNADSIPDSGESIRMDVAIENDSSVTTTGLTAVLSTTDEYVTITNDSFTYGTIEAGYYQSINETDEGITGGSSSAWYATQDPSTPSAFTYKIADTCPPGHATSFTLTMTDNLGNEWVDDTTIEVTVGGPSIVLDAYEDDDDGGNADSIANPGESMLMDVRLNNSGTSDVLGLTAVLSTTDEYVTITNDSFTYGNINAGYYQTINETDENMIGGSSYSTYASLDPSTPSAFIYDMNSGCPIDHVITFTLTMTDSSNNVWTDTIDVTVEATGASLCIDAYEDDDDGGNADAIPNPEEAILMDVRLNNSGTSNVLGLTAVLSTTDEYVDIKNDSFTYATIKAGYYQTINETDENMIGGSSYSTYSSLDPSTPSAFTYDIDSGCPIDHVITFTLTMTDSWSNVWTDTIDVTVPKAGANVYINAYADIDLTGNYNGKPSAGENVSMDIRIHNQGKITASGIDTVLSSNSGYITITNDSFTYGNINALYYHTIYIKDNGYNSGYSSSSATLDSSTTSAFTYSVAGDCPYGTEVTFTLTFTDSNGVSWTDDFIVVIE